MVSDSHITVLLHLGEVHVCFFSKVVCVLSSDKKAMYDGIKKYLCVNCPIPSQCVVAQTLDKPQTLMTVATKIAQQMNCKMGGALWKVQTGVRWISWPSLYLCAVEFVQSLFH